MTAAILLAAGESTRMGRPKALLPWRDATLVEYQVRELSAAGVKHIAVVLGHAAAEVRPQVPEDAQVVVNEAYRDGRASSLRAGAAALPDDADPIVVLSVDQPRPRDELRALLASHGQGGVAITVPVHEGRRGHPPVLAGALLPELRAASEEAQGLRGVLTAHQDVVREVVAASAIILLDLNTPEQYQQALARYGDPSNSA